MNIYEMFIEMKRQETKTKRVICQDTTFGTTYDNIKDLPIWFAEQPSEYGTFMFELIYKVE